MSKIFDYGRLAVVCACLAHVSACGGDGEAEGADAQVGIDASAGADGSPADAAIATDAAIVDALSMADAAVAADGALADALLADATPPDATPPDAIPADASPPDAIPPDAMPMCGNGIVEFGETCDDGNTASNDGCNGTCLAFEMPGGIYSPSMAYDAHRQVVVLFGGATAGDETWEWNGSTWKRNITATTPPPRQRFAMAYHPGRKRTYMFGGTWSGTDLGDTWEYDGTNWRDVTGVASPSARRFHRMAYDVNRTAIVMFGGRHEAPGTVAVYSDTWAFDGAIWAELSPATAPRPRYAHQVAYDSTRRRLVMYGGITRTEQFTDSVWEFDGSTWALSPVAGPGNRALHAMSYDASRGYVIVHGGQDVATTLSDTWTYDGSTWTNQTPVGSPPPRTRHAMAYDAARAKSVIHGGAPAPSNTWVTTGTSWQDATP